MSDEFEWDEFAGDRMKFDNIGDHIEGRIRAIRVETGQKGDKVPCLTLQVDKAGTEREVWAGSTDLKQQMAALRPQVGWWLDITFVGEKHTGQPQPMKLFTVNTKPPKPAGSVAGTPAEAREALAPTPKEPEKFVQTPPVAEWDRNKESDEVGTTLADFSDDDDWDGTTAI